MIFDAVSLLQAGTRLFQRWSMIFLKWLHVWFTMLAPLVQTFGISTEGLGCFQEPFSLAGHDLPLLPILLCETVQLLSLLSFCSRIHKWVKEEANAKPPSLHSHGPSSLRTSLVLSCLQQFVPIISNAGLPLTWLPLSIRSF